MNLYICIHVDPNRIITDVMGKGMKKTIFIRFMIISLTDHIGSKLSTLKFLLRFFQIADNKVV